MSRTRALMIALSLMIYTAAADRAQTPITSLPRPGEAGTSDATSAPNATPLTAPDQPYAPYASVHPITSLPKPPGMRSFALPQPTGSETAAAPPAYTPPAYTVPAPVVDTAPAAASSSSAASSAASDSAASNSAASSSSVAANTAATLPAHAPMYALPGSSSTRLAAAPPAPTPTLEAPLRASTSQEAIVLVKQPPPKVRPFSTFAIQFKIGTNGIGFDAAVPLSQHFDLRGGGSIFSYAGSYDDSGDDITGAAQFRSGEFYVDYYPFSHGPLRISGGMVINGSYLNATTLVKSGEQFDLNNVTYYSSASDPVHGTAAFSFGHKAAPSLTIGLGSMIPRTGKHISFPFEAGFMYVGDPALSLTLMGTVCDTSNPPNCQKIDNDPAAQANLQQEVNTINSDIHFLRFFPILSQGISIKF